MKAVNNTIGYNRNTTGSSNLVSGAQTDRGPVQ